MRFWPLVLIFLCSAAFANRPTLTYKPAKIELEGILSLQTFPGPPSFDSIKGGDDIERHFYLKLDVPVDVAPSSLHPTIDNPDEELNVKVMQLSIPEDDALWTRFRKMGDGGHVKIRGSLFHRFTGHHHSRVLLMVDTMEPVSKSK